MDIMNYYSSLKTKAKEHKMYYHYTNLQSLYSIISERSFRLTQLKLLNDPDEENRLDAIKRNKVFVACFNHEPNESIKLWELYANGSAGIRIGFPDLNFFIAAKQYYYIDNETKVFLPTDVWEVREAETFDVEYVSNLNDHKVPFDPLNTGAYINYPVNIGLVKQTTWDYEHETRARIGIDVTIGASSRTFGQGPPGYRYPHFKYIYCSLDTNTLQNMEITFNPTMSNENKAAVKYKIKRYLGNFNNENFNNSVLVQ